MYLRSPDFNIKPSERERERDGGGGGEERGRVKLVHYVIKLYFRSPGLTAVYLGDCLLIVRNNCLGTQSCPSS